MQLQPHINPKGLSQIAKDQTVEAVGPFQQFNQS